MKNKALTYIAALTGDEASEMVFTAIPEAPGRRTTGRPITWRASFEDSHEKILDLQQNGYGIFVAIQRMSGSRRHSDDCIGIRTLAIDIDDPEVSYTHTLTPSFIVHSSPGKRHLYFLVDDCLVSEYSKWQSHLAKIVGGDPSVTDLARVLRLPGSFHLKNAAIEVGIELCDDSVAIYGMEDIEKTFGLPPEPTHPVKVSDYPRLQHNGETVDRCRKWLNDLVDIAKDPEEQKKRGGRNNTIHQTALDVRWLVFEGYLSAEEVRKALEDLCMEVDPDRGYDPVNSAFRASRDNHSRAFVKFLRQFPNPRLSDHKELTWIEEIIKLVTKTDAWDNAFRFDGDQYWVYGDGAWGPRSKNWFRAQVGLLEQNNYVYTNNKGVDTDVNLKSSQIASIATRAQTIPFIFEEDFVEKFGSGIALADGTAIFAGKRQITTEPWNTEHRIVRKLPYGASAPAAQPTQWIAALDRIFAGDEDLEAKKLFLAEWYGAAMLGIAPQFSTALILFGERGANGKSTLMETLEEALFGEKYVAHIEPHLWTDAYSLDALNGKYLNSVAELPQGDLIGSNKIKGVITGEKTQARKIYCEPYSMLPKAGHVFSANFLPPTIDLTSAFFRRWVIIGFNNTFSGQKNTKSSIKYELLEEREAIFHWALDGARRLVENQRYTEVPSSNTLKQSWQLKSNNVAEYVQDKGMVPGGELVKTKELYVDYESYCAAAGAKPLKRTNFVDRMLALGFKKSRVNNIRGLRVSYIEGTT